MSFRSRVLLAFAVVVLVPIATVALGVRGEIEDRLRAQYEARVSALASVIEEDVDREGREIGGRLAALGDDLVADNRFRAAAAGPGASSTDRSYLLDHAGDAMRLMGLAMLQIHDEDGRILSSGHFRNAFDLIRPELPRSLADLPSGTALSPVRTAAGDFLALLRVDSIRVADRSFYLVGGVQVGEAFLQGLARDPELTVRLIHPAGVVGGAGAEGPRPDVVVARTLTLPYLDPGVPLAAADAGGETGGGAEAGTDGPTEARFEIAYDGATLRAIQRSTNLWLAFVLLGATALATLLAGWLSARVTRPLADLARKTSRVDLERLDVDFPSRGPGEIGQLSRVLGQMTERLRAGARDLRDAERRATLGELARQVNHDIRNGLAPIRNVLRHLDQVAAEAPSRLSGVYQERKESLTSSIGYLETLAGNYRRLSRRAGSGTADPNAIAELVVAGAGADSPVAVSAEADPMVPPVRCDPVTLRRIIENLVANAKDACTDADTVTVRTGTGRAPHTVRVVVEDSGRGMSEAERARAFEDFYTTKTDGTGLGLPVVRRLVADLGGTLALESEEGRGTRILIELPATGNGGRSGSR